MVAVRTTTADARRAHNRAQLRLVRIDDADAVRADELPEHAVYRDNGCDLAPSCLRCPFERCKYDAAVTRRRSNAARDREIALLRRKYGAPLHMLCQTYGLSRRSVFRILKDSRQPATDGGRKKDAGRRPVREKREVGCESECRGPEAYALNEAGRAIQDATAVLQSPAGRRPTR